MELVMIRFQTYWEKGSIFPVHLLVDGTGFQAVVEKGSLLPVQLLKDGSHRVPNKLGEGFHFSSTFTSRWN